MNENPLPVQNDMEWRHRHKVLDALKQATRACKNPYDKGKQSFEILGKLDPACLRRLLPSFERLERILNAKL